MMKQLLQMKEEEGMMLSLARSYRSELVAPEIDRFRIFRPGHRGILPEIKQDCSSFVHLKFAESMQDFATI